MGRIIQVHTCKSIKFHSRWICSSLVVVKRSIQQIILREMPVADDSAWTSCEVLPTTEYCPCLVSVGLFFLGNLNTKLESLHKEATSLLVLHRQTLQQLAILKRRESQGFEQFGCNLICTTTRHSPYGYNQITIEQLAITTQTSYIRRYSKNLQGQQRKLRQHLTKQDGNAWAKSKNQYNQASKTLIGYQNTSIHPIQ